MAIRSGRSERRVMVRSPADKSSVVLRQVNFREPAFIPVE
jgi:hypothetical protein